MIFWQVLTASTASGLRDSAQACTLWRGVAALLIELVDDPDPLQVGETTTYTIRVTNQGTADDNNVVIVANFPNGITPTTATGGTVAGLEAITLGDVQERWMVEALQTLLREPGNPTVTER